MGDPSFRRADSLHSRVWPKSPTGAVRKRVSNKLARVNAGNTSARETAAPRVLELDGLRGLACLTILAYHVRPAAVPYGWASVDLFFVLSGYLITAILIRHRGSPGLLRNFYARRGLRIWPIYYLTIVALVIFGPWLPRPTSWNGLGYYLTYTQNLPLYWSGRVPPFSPYLNHFWTLANEEQFYIVWPIPVILLGRRALIPLTLVVAAISVAARTRGFDSWLLLARADGFALGGLLAAVFADNQRVARQLVFYRRTLASITLIALAAVAVAMARGILPVFGRPPIGAGFSVLAINVLFAGTIGLIVLHAGRPIVVWLRRPRLVHLGTLSYGLYVYHYIVLMAADDMLVALRGYGRTSINNVALIALTYGMALASWFWFEKPLLNLKRRFDYRTLAAHQTDSESSDTREAAATEHEPAVQYFNHQH
jgi:peptidoglycan/LPS O-acetylase OafA/YrhL